MTTSKQLIYGYNDTKHQIKCILKDITFKGMDIIIHAETADGNLIIAPIEMFKSL